MDRPASRRPAVLALSLALLAGAGLTHAQDRAACERVYSPEVGQAGKDVIWVPTPDALVTRMLEMARTTKNDFVVDLGAGDGKIAIAAARQFGARALGIEYNPDLAKLAQCFAQADGVADRARIVQGDIFKEDFSTATVVTMYLLPELNTRLRPTLLRMRPGTRIVSHAFDLDDWSPDETATVEGRTAYLWIVPAAVAGTWEMRESGAREARTVRLTQAFQRINGDLLQRRNRASALLDASLRGQSLTFAYTDERGRVQRVAGRVDGQKFAGTVTGPNGVRPMNGVRTVAGPTVPEPAAEAPATTQLR